MTSFATSLLRLPPISIPNPWTWVAFLPVQMSRRQQEGGCDFSARLTRAVHTSSWLFPLGTCLEVLSFYGNSLATLRRHAGGHVERSGADRDAQEPCCSSARSLTFSTQRAVTAHAFSHSSPSHQLPIITGVPQNQLAEISLPPTMSDWYF